MLRVLPLSNVQDDIRDGTLFIETGTSIIIKAIRMDVMNFRASM